MNALKNVIDVIVCGEFDNTCIDGMKKVIKKYPLSSRDRALVKEISYGAIRKRSWLDAWINCLAKIPSNKQPPNLRWILHLGLYQIFIMDRIPEGAAVNTSVQLTKQGKLFKLAPVVNGILRAAVRAKDSGQKLPRQSNKINQIATKQS